MAGQSQLQIFLLEELIEGSRARPSNSKINRNFLSVPVDEFTSGQLQLK